MTAIGITHRPNRKPNGITKADREALKSDDLLKRDFKADKPFSKCVTDITEVKAKNGKLYVSTIFDCYDLTAVGLSMDDNMRTELCAAAVENTASAYPEFRGAVLHSDRGSQYTSASHRAMLKASSSGAIKPPMAADLLDYYIAEQLRMHFLGLGVGQRSVSFMPKPYNPNAKPEDPDPVVKDGFLLSNVFNRIIRTCIYSTQKYFDGIMPVGEVDEQVLADAKKAILDYERFMYRFEFHQATYVLDSYIRKASKYMAKNLGDADKADDNEARRHTLIQVFHMIRTAAVLLHPMAPKGTEMILEYLQLDKSFWSWDKIFDTIADFTDGKDHKLKFLEPRVDFFTKHPSQLGTNTEE